MTLSERVQKRALCSQVSYALVTMPEEESGGGGGGVVEGESDSSRPC